MEGLCLKFTPLIVKRLLGYLSMFGPIADTSWIVQTVLTEALTHLHLPTHPCYVPSVIVQWL